MQVIPYKTSFLQIFSELKKHPLFKRMETTVEGSPWHREANVLVHTEMVVAEYIRLTDEVVSEWTYQDFLGAVVSMFHDVGKPKAKIEKTSAERGTYFAFHGHEVISARLFEDFIMSKQHVQLSELLLPDAVANVSMLIEYHMPWRIEDVKKRTNIAKTMNKFNIDVYTRTLLADQFGRIADDQEKKNADALKWVEEFVAFAATIDYNQELGVPLLMSKVMFIPIGASGSGKSTAYKKLVEEHGSVASYSLDALRHEWYDAVDYTKAYEGSVADSKFEQKTKDRFNQMMKEGHSYMYIDNTNLSAKRRKFYLDAAKQYGYNTVAVLLPIDMKTLTQRQMTRKDKYVPDAAVRQQYFSLQMPLFGEFDHIQVQV